MTPYPIGATVRSWRGRALALRHREQALIWETPADWIGRHPSVSGPDDVVSQWTEIRVPCHEGAELPADFRRALAKYIRTRDGFEDLTRQMIKACLVAGLEPAEFRRLDRFLSLRVIVENDSDYALRLVTTPDGPGWSYISTCYLHAAWLAGEEAPLAPPSDAEIAAFQSRLMAEIDRAAAGDESPVALEAMEKELRHAAAAAEASAGDQPFNLKLPIVGDLVPVDGAPAGVFRPVPSATARARLEAREAGEDPDDPAEDVPTDDGARNPEDGRGASPAEEDVGFLSPTDLAKALRVPEKADAIRVQLNRLLKADTLPGSAWMENANPTASQAKILYRLSAVRPFLARYWQSNGRTCSPHVHPDT